MEREMNILLWSIFGIGVLTVAVIPSAWGMLGHTTAAGSVENANMAQVLWGQSTPVSETVSQMANDSGVAIIPGATAPHIESVAWNTSVWGPELTLTGYGFGNTPQNQNGTLTIGDQSRGWVAGNAASYGVQPTIQTWRNDKIVVTGFAGYGQSDASNWNDGLGSWVFAPGDNLAVQVENPQTGVAGTDNVTYPENAPMPSLRVNAIAKNLTGGTVTDISGDVTFGGQSLSNQVVNVSVTGGTLQGTAYQNNTSEYVVQTDANGDFSVPYTVPNQPGTYQVSVMVDSVSSSVSVTVWAPKIELQENTSTPEIGQSDLVSGQLTSNGTPLVNEVITFSTTGGTISPTTVTTDANGRFQATYTAPNTSGTYTITAQGAGTSAQSSITVTEPPLSKGPVMNNMPSQWSGNWASHMYLTNLPSGAQILATNGSQPTAAYFRYGNGQVFVDTQTVEYYYNSAAWATTEWNNTINDFLSPSHKPVLLLNDGASWGSNQQAVSAIERAVQNVTQNSLSSPSIPNINQYGTIVIDAVQDSYFAQNLEQVIPQLDTWIQHGGTLIFDSTDQANSGVGWNIGPDGISNVWDLQAENYLAGNIR
ncbi:Ig-like domain-containing protein [Alicyclobacillus ferrooxydans]|uniref:Uncharacterized protein n=1 Tax=Alicyclobacillus ferrooxydans TaxID=471514 RepID=A0A0P9CJ29_9BACL|nr:Ig-like domain-containing protein [Alicyclobacillus ferrooxydans]KPV45651.1 hypothetical protein AN477_01685 [Alicyclobacillus ferrooxydans]